MASWKEIEALKHSPANARTLAKSLLATSGLSAWEEPFLESMSLHEGQLSTRQSEKLLELRDESLWVSSIRGFSVRLMLQSCWESRHDLDDDDDVEFIERLEATRSTTAKYRDARRLLNIARKLGVIDR